MRWKNRPTISTCVNIPLTSLLPPVICRVNHRELKLVGRVRSFFSLPDSGPKSWWQGRTLPTKIVNINSFGLLQLVHFIAEHCLWGSKQCMTLWRDLENYSMEIKSDENLLRVVSIDRREGISMHQCSSN